MRNWIWCALLATLIGCGQSGGSGDSIPPAAGRGGSDNVGLASREEIKSFLTALSMSGQLGSGITVLKASIEKLKTVDSPAAETLQAFVPKLEEATDPEAIKAIAQEMLGKLI